MQKLKPVPLPPYLVHVDVASGNRLVPSFESFVFVPTRRPFAKVLHHVDQGFAEFFSHYWEPVNIWARLKINTLNQPHIKRYKNLPEDFSFPDLNSLDSRDE